MLLWKLNDTYVFLLTLTFFNYASDLVFKGNDDHSLHFFFFFFGEKYEFHQWLFSQCFHIQFGFLFHPKAFKFLHFQHRTQAINRMRICCRKTGTQSIWIQSNGVPINHCKNRAINQWKYYTIWMHVYCHKCIVISFNSAVQNDSVIWAQKSSVETDGNSTYSIVIKWLF